MNPTLIIAAAIALAAYCICAHFIVINLFRRRRVRAYLWLLAAFGFVVGGSLNVNLAFGSTPDINNDRIVNGDTSGEGGG